MVQETLSTKATRGHIPAADWSVLLGLWGTVSKSFVVLRVLAVLRNSEKKIKA